MMFVKRNKFSWLLGAMLIAGAMLIVGADRSVVAQQSSLPEQADFRISENVLAAQAERIAVMRRAAAATVAVFGLDGGGGGSGVLISADGYALTNYHVSSACGDHMRCGLDDSRIYDAVIVGVDAVGDLSLIKLLGRDDFPTAPLADSSTVKVGQWCFSAGNPFGLAANRQPSISLGIVSGINRYQYPAGTILEYADCLQTDAAVNPGNSGGPLFNLSGQVIGINGRCSFEKRGRINVGVGYAISSNQVRLFLSMLKSGRLLDHATMGATVSTDELGRVVVSNILSSSDAYRRGLRYGDQVIRLADREVVTTNSFKNILGTLPKELRVPIVIRRDGKEMTLLVRLTGVHSANDLIKIVAMGLDGPEDGKPPKPPSPKPLQDEPGSPESQPAPTDQSEQLEPPESPAKPNENLQRDPVTGKLPPGLPDTKLVASMLESRAGFANYYFNRAQRDSITKQLATLGDHTSLASVKFRGKLAGESTRLDLTVSGSQSELTLGSRRSQYSGDISDVVASRNQGGLAIAIKAMKELLQQGPEKIGETIYLGQLPVYARSTQSLRDQDWHEVLETLWYDARVRFHWDSQLKELSLIELFGDEGTDPVELYMDRYQTVAWNGQDCRWPSRLRLRYGMEDAVVVEVEQWILTANATTEPVAEKVDEEKVEDNKGNAVEPESLNSESTNPDASSELAE